MKRKIMCFIGIVILLICVISYFKPLSFSNIVNNNTQIQMILRDLGIKNGEAHNEAVEYTNINAEQQSKILTALEKYNYRRNFKTLFSDGSISDTGSKLLSIYVYEDDLYSNSIMVSSSGKIIVNNKNYSMKNAEQLIEQIVEIVEQED